MASMSACVPLPLGAFSRSAFASVRAVVASVIRVCASPFTSSFFAFASAPAFSPAALVAWANSVAFL